MIKYNLRCHEEHEFESWFSSSEEFEKLIKRKFAIVKGLDGLDELHDHIIKYGADAENIVCYKRKKFLG